MDNVKANYKTLLVEYETASKLFQETGLTRLLAHALENLEQFERKFIECYSLKQLLELQIEFRLKSLLVV